MRHFLLLKRRRAPRTLEYYEECLRSFFNFVEQFAPRPVTLDSITPIVVLEYLDWLAQRVAPETVHNRFRGVRALARWMEREQYIRRAWTANIPAPERGRKRMPVYRQPDFEAMMTWLPKTTWWGARDRAIIMVMMLTGIRRQELSQADLSDVDLGAETLRVMGKGNKPRTVWLPPPAAEALLRYSRHRKKDKPALIQTVHGERLSGNAIYKVVQKLGQRAGITGVRCSPHTLRHSFALQYLRAGGEMRHLQHILGHESLQATQVYVRELEDEDARQQHRKIDPFRGWVK